MRPLAYPPSCSREGRRRKASGSPHPLRKLLEKFSKHVAPCSRKTSLEERKRRVRAEPEREGRRSSSTGEGCLLEGGGRNAEQMFRLPELPRVCGPL